MFYFYDIDTRKGFHQLQGLLPHGHLDVDTPASNQVILHPKHRMEHVLPGICASPPHSHQGSTPASIPLSLSHSGILLRMLVGYTDTILLQDTVIDSSTQDVLIAIQVYVSWIGG